MSTLRLSSAASTLREVPAGAGTERVGWLVKEQNEVKGEQYSLLAAEGGASSQWLNWLRCWNQKSCEGFKWAKLAALKGSARVRDRLPSHLITGVEH